MRTRLGDTMGGAPPETRRSEGGGVWAEYLPKAALMLSNDLFRVFLDYAIVRVPPRGLAGGRGDRHWTGQENKIY